MRHTLIAFLFLGIIGCAPAPFVKMKPFIDVDETILLSPKMTKNTVLQYLGMPVEVRAGITNRENVVVEIWIYYVKERLVKVPIDALKSKPPKNFKAEDWGSEKKYALFFYNDELSKWGYLDDIWQQFKDNGDLQAPVPNPEAPKVDTSSHNGLFGILKSK